jgi:hypothetical protein
MGTVGVAASVSFDPLLALALALPALLALLTVAAVVRRDRAGDDDEPADANVFTIEEARETRAARGSSTSPRWR